MALRYCGLLCGLCFCLSLGAQDETAARQWLADQHHNATSAPAFALRESRVDERTGLRHFYFQQTLADIPVRNGLASVHLAADGSLVHGNYQPRAVGAPPAASPRISSTQAAAAALTGHHPAATTYASQLVWVSAAGGLHLSWAVEGQDPVSGDYWIDWIDAENGAVLQRHTRTAECRFHPREALANAGTPRRTSPGQPSAVTAVLPGRYNAFALPKVSPLEDTRAIVLADDLADPAASPHGWHDTDEDGTTAEFVYTKGNNTYAYYATPPSSDPPAVPIMRTAGVYTGGNVPSPAGDDLDFDYQNYIYQPLGSSFIEDAVTNLFVVTNQAHDIFHQYGFDAAAGNFQTTNYEGEDGAGDAVLARSQDGGGVNNASFSTPPDGMPPTMRMFLWTFDEPNSVRDGSFENGVVVHEYGHGVTYRLIQGAGNVDCFFNYEQGGEGWSDFFGLMLTMQDRNGNGRIDRNLLGEGVRGLGQYMLARETSHPGLRPAHYTGNMGDEPGSYVNNYVYSDVYSLVFPHGVGFLWASMLWDITLDLMDQYGYEPNIYNSSSNGGNVRAMNLVMTGLTMTPCNPTFLDMRDAVLAADQALYGGAHQELLWNAFARRGLGFSAEVGGMAAYDSPIRQLTAAVDQQAVPAGETFQYTLTVENNSNSNLQGLTLTNPVDSRLEVVATDPGGVVQGNTVKFNNLGSLAVGTSKSRSFTVRYTAGPATEVLTAYPVETGDLVNFINLGSWIPSSDNPNPATSSTQSWFQLASPVVLESSLEFFLTLPAGANNHLSFYHDYDLEYAIDGGVLEIEQGAGNWVDLGDKIRSSRYRAIIRDDLIGPTGTPIPFTTLSRRRAWTGSSNGYERCVVDLSDYSGSTVRLRFRFAGNTGNNVGACDSDPGGCDGWFIDDIELLDLVHVRNEACFSANGLSDPICSDVGRLGTIITPSAALPLVDMQLQAKTQTGQVLLSWLIPEELVDIDFELQRKTAAQPEFRNLIPATDERNYVDYRVEAGEAYYYRLYGEAPDGTAYYSRIIGARLPAPPAELIVQPNPAAELTRLSWEQPLPGTGTMVLLDATGRILDRYALSPDSRNFVLSVADLPSGVYTVRIMAGRRELRGRIVVR